MIGERSGAVRAAELLAELPALRGNTVDLLIDGGATFASIFEGIDQAREYLLIQFFIVKDDDLGRQPPSLDGSVNAPWGSSAGSDARSRAKRGRHPAESKRLWPLLGARYALYALLAPSGTHHEGCWVRNSISAILCIRAASSLSHAKTRVSSPSQRLTWCGLLPRP